jgi:hypothetical protein
MGWAGVLEGCEIEGISVAFVVCGGGWGRAVLILEI